MLLLGFTNGDNDMNPRDTLKSDLKKYGTKGIALLVCLSLIACVLLSISVVRVAEAGLQSMLFWTALALILGLTSARYPIRFPGTATSVSVSETLLFLGVIVLGTYHGTLLAVVEVLVAGRRLKINKPSVHLFNVSNHTISFFIAGTAYYRLSDYFAVHSVASGIGQRLLAFALPLIALSLVHYLLHIVTFTAMSLARNASRANAVRETLPWAPVTYFACATVAGLVHYALINKGLMITAVTLVLVLPIPIIIYYTFKTYHDKLGEQESHYKQLTGIYDSILEMLAMAIDAKDDVTHDHIQRVKLFARRMGETVGLSELEIEALKAGALLHDIGKIGVPAYILNKPGKLTEHEFEQMKMHTIIGADMLSNVDFRYPVVPIVRHHHERWDGRGYPDGLKGDAIPITARILTLVDNYDALRSDRPYKTGMTREEALAFIKQNAGTFFDPQLVEIFLSMVDQLEQEAINFKPPPTNKRSKADSAAMANATPAAGFDTVPQLDRAAAALNSIAETNQRVTALYEMSRTLSSILSVEDTVAILTNRLSKLMPFTTCAISLFDASRSEFEIAHATGLHAERFLKRRMPAEAGITGWVITNQRPMYNTNPVLDLGFLGSAVANSYKAVIVFPLVKNEEPLGAIALYSTEIAAYGSEHIQLMESISQPASDAVYNALTFERAQRGGYSDSGSGLVNVRALTTLFDRESARSRRIGMPLSLVIVNLNDPDDVSDGRNTRTDQLVAQLERLVRQQVRETDVVARYTSNSLIALLPESGQSETTGVRGRIREEAQLLQMSISLGAATSPDDGESFDELLRAAQMDCSASHDSVEITPTTLTEVTVVRTN
jgi:diguanylate cyclase (GGDEF)-like protein/putative nucleotidyltransferase with HDIG domain